MIISNKWTFKYFYIQIYFPSSFIVVSCHCRRRGWCDLSEDTDEQEETGFGQFPPWTSLPASTPPPVAFVITAINTQWMVFGGHRQCLANCQRVCTMDSQIDQPLQVEGAENKLNQFAATTSSSSYSQRQPGLRENQSRPLRFRFPLVSLKRLKTLGQ